MIQVLSLQEALDWYQALPANEQLATLSPHYVLADARRDDHLQPLFLGYREGESFWLHGVHRAALPVDEPGFDHQSAYGYGGPMANCRQPEFLQRAWQAYVGYCEKTDVLAEFVRLHPMTEQSALYG